MLLCTEEQIVSSYVDRWTTEELLPVPTSQSL